MATSHAAKRGGSSDMIESMNPTTGEVLGRVPVCSAEEVEAAVRRGRDAGLQWSALSFAERRHELLRWQRALAGQAHELAELVHKENGKPRLDALLEIMVALDHLAFAAHRAEKVLAPRRVRAGLLINYRATISYHPLGVVGVIGPWNYPVLTPMGSIAHALAAGNAVVFKPSELTPLVGEAMVELAASAMSIPGVLQVVTGAGETGAALVSAGVDKIAFTGSTATGKKIMARAAETLTPVLMELGGKDPLIVSEDAELDKAARAAVYGAFTNAGQACISVERAYVVSAVYDRFVDRVVEETRRVRAGGAHADMGVITRPAQVDIIREHIRDALDKGARAVVGGLSTMAGNLVTPTVLVDVTPDMKIVKEETFGPVLPIIEVPHVDEAVRLANQGRYGLGSSIFGRARVRELASSIRAGMTSINSVMSYVAIPALPFGGVGDSGFGRIHGDEGLREFTRIHAMAEERFANPLLPLGFHQPEGMASRVRSLIEHLYGSGWMGRAMSALRRL